MTVAKAIPTRYQGYHFRSRLEARWAVFFSTLRVEWKYEPQGYYLGGCRLPDCGMNGGIAEDGIYWSGGCSDQTHTTKYLPDFFLPDTDTWVEVKGSSKTIDWQLLANAVDSWGSGLPGTADSEGTTRGLLLLGDIPTQTTKRTIHPLLQHRKGGWVNYGVFIPGGLETVLGGSFSYFDSTWGEQKLTEPWIKAVIEALPGNRTMEHLQRCHSDVARAYDAARSARFEHGQSGT